MLGAARGADRRKSRHRGGLATAMARDLPGRGRRWRAWGRHRGKPDGYTLLLTVSSAHVINPSLYKSPGFDPVQDFEPITPVATAGYALVANNNFPANNVSELIAVAKKQPGKIAIASAGNGTLNHLIGETLKGFGSTPWYGLFAPAGTPKAIVAQLQAQVAKALDTPDAREKLAAVGCEPFKSTPEQFAAQIKAELPQWARIVKESGATVD